MEKIKYTMTLDNFLANEKIREGTTETIIDMIKKQMLEKLYFDKLKGKEDDFIIQFKNEYWDYNKINYIIDNFLEVTNGLYRNPLDGGFIDRAELYKLISDKKPFDIILILKTKKELDYEIELKERFPDIFITKPKLENDIVKK